MREFKHAASCCWKQPLWPDVGIYLAYTQNNYKIMLILYLSHSADDTDTIRYDGPLRIIAEFPRYLLEYAW